MIPEKRFIDMFLGEMNKAEWAFHLLLMFMGILLYVLFRIKNRKNKGTKPSFSVWFSNIDNIIAFIISLILSYILIRFYSNYQEALIQYLPDWLKVGPYLAMVILGFGQHKIAEYLGKKAAKL